MRMNRSHRTLVDGEPAPDRNDEYRFYQALVGAWPNEEGIGNQGSESGIGDRGSQIGDRESGIEARKQPAPDDFSERMRAYMIKSVKEAKRHTSWLTPNERYENAVLRFVERVLTGAGRAKFLPAFLPLQQRIALAGMVNSLAQLTLKLGSPGIPDFYQGSELWDLSLVDPDNRRPVDFSRRAALLTEVEAVLASPPHPRRSAVGDMQRRWQDGRIKLLITTAGLRLRREWSEVFFSGAYVPLETEVSVQADVVAFARVLDDRAALFVAPRLATPVVASTGLPVGGAAWKTSRILLPPELAGRTFRHLITGSEVRATSTNSHSWLFAGEIFDTVPCGILIT
jgi:(1->4)-alpha-D-glucan 1-alpha-D-glucosylmutase